MQRTGMDPVHQQVQVQTDAADWDVDPVQTLVYAILRFASF